MATNSELEARVSAIEAHLAKLGTPRFVPGEKPTAWEEVTVDLTHKQKDALRGAGLTTLKSLKEAAAKEDGFTRIDGLGAAADTKLRAALEAYHA